MSATASIIFLVGALVYLVFRKEDDRSSKIWFFGCLLMASGMIVLLFRHHLPGLIGFAVNNFIMLYAMVLFRNSFWMIENPEFKSSKLPLAFCIYHGLLIWGLAFTSYRDEIGLVAAINWVILYAWIYFDSGGLQKKINNPFFVIFRIMLLMGIVAWALRVYLASKFDIASASDQKAMNALSLLFSHIVLIGAQFVYLIVRLTDEKSKKIKIQELNTDLEKLWTERNRLLKEKQLQKDTLLRDIHDGFGSQLASLRILAARGRISQEEFSQSLGELSTDLHLVVDTLGNENLNLADALSDMRHRMRQYSDESGIQIRWNINLSNIQEISPSNILHILRIIQEAITNGLRHAKASKIEIYVGHDDKTNSLQIRISDDGNGFSDEARSGRGLTNMRHRAKELGGELNLAKNPSGKGSFVELAVPLHGQTAREHASRLAI